MNHRTLALPAVCALLWMLAGCAGDIDAGTGGNTGGGGDGGAGASGGSGGGGGDGGTGGQGTGASGGAGGDGAGIPTLDGVPECAPLKASFQGSLDGEEVSGTFDTSGVAKSGGIQIEFGDLGRIYLVSKDGDDSDVVHPVTGLLRMPEDSKKPGEWYCAGEGSELLLSPELTPSVVLRSISHLGACPGEPVGGSMVACLPEGDCPAGVTSTVPGASFEVPLDGFFSITGPTGGTEATASATLLGSGGVLVLEAIAIQPDSTGAQTSALGAGFITIPTGQPDAGAVYCFGEGSTLEYEIQGGFPAALTANLQNVTRLGSCPATPTRGELGFCMSMDR